VRLKIVPRARRDHHTFTRSDALATAINLQRQRAAQAEQDLEMRVVVAAVRGTVVANRELAHHAHHGVQA
jgi:hypothetical protein